MSPEAFAGIVGTALGAWLMIMFAGIIYWALRPKNKERFEDDGMIPFKEDMDTEH